jgi:hypothetical protein
MGQRFFMFGAVLLMLGAQLRFVDSYVLTTKASHFIESNLQNSGLEESSPYDPYMYSVGPSSTVKKTFTPPHWLGWAFLSVGAVLVLHSLTISQID